MTMIVVFVIALLAAFAAWCGWRRVAVGAAVVELLLLSVACGPLPYLLLSGLQHPYPGQVSGVWAERNAIILLGAGTTRVAPGESWEPPLFAYGRIARTASLYRACKASGKRCLVLVSGDDAQHHGVTEAAVYGARLQQLGVPLGDLELESRSMNTWQNAQFSRPLLLAYAPQKLLLVTSGFHMRRSLLYFAHFGIRPMPIRADLLQVQLSWLPLAWNMALCDVTLHEYMGVARYAIYNAMGWNAPAVHTPIIPSRPGE